MVFFWDKGKMGATSEGWGFRVFQNLCYHLGGSNIREESV